VNEREFEFHQLMMSVLDGDQDARAVATDYLMEHSGLDKTRAEAVISAYLRLQHHLSPESDVGDANAGVAVAEAFWVMLTGYSDLEPKQARRALVDMLRETATSIQVLGNIAAGRGVDGVGRTSSHLEDDLAIIGDVTAGVLKG